MNWLIIFAMFSHPGGPKALEYLALATESECIEIGERSIKRNKEHFEGLAMWVTYRCVDIHKMLETSE
ncbi:MAG: hypothetical protein E5W82_10275 [Mesorhizobium sp.]|nr:MAG: hypothetical protein E5W82_10275 [Mesorhizobium sp.]